MKRFDRIDTRLDRVEERLRGIEGQQTPPKNLLSFLQDRQLVGLFLIALVVFLFIIASVTGTEVPKWAR